MTVINLMKFAGEASGVTPRHIPEGYAQSAMDCDVTQATLKGIRAPLASGETVNRANPVTIFKYANGQWLSWLSDVDVCRSPLADDQWGRIYWTGDGYPKVVSVDVATGGVAPYPNLSYKLGVPAPSVILGATAAAGTEPDTVLNVTYAYSYVSAYGEEGPISLPSPIVKRWDEGGDASITIPSVNAPNVNVTTLRIYRSEDGGAYNQVIDLPVGTSSYVDTVQTANLATEAVSIEWDPPKDSMIGLTSTQGNYFIGFFDNVLCFSEPGYPHAWPISYRIALDDDIVGVAVAATGIVVCTKGMPVLVVGSVPSAMDSVKIETYQACVAKRSIVDMGDYVLYASPDGLVSVGSVNGIITGNLMTKERWTFLNPASIHAYREGDRYLAFYTDKDGNSGSFAFSPTRGFEFFSATCSTAYYDAHSDILYMAQGAGLVEFDSGNRLPYEWHSGIYEMQPGTSFSCAKVVADSYPVTLDVLVEGALMFSVMATNNRMFRLPAGYFHGREVSVKVRASGEVFSVQIAQSPSELI